MNFLRMISCSSSQTTLSPPCTQEGYRYDFQYQGYNNLPTRLNVPHEDLLCNVQGHMSITHARLRISSILSQEIIFTLYIYQVTDTNLTKQDTQILHI